MSLCLGHTSAYHIHIEEESSLLIKCRVTASPSIEKPVQGVCQNCTESTEQSENVNMILVVRYILGQNMQMMLI